RRLLCSTLFPYTTLFRSYCFSCYLLNSYCIDHQAKERIQLKKMIIFAVVLEVIFIALFAVVNYQNNKKVEGNPYGKSKLDPATIDRKSTRLNSSHVKISY